MTRIVSHLSTVSVVALGVALAGPLRAETKGFLGSFNVQSGSVFISESTDTTDFNVLSARSVIDWTPDDNANNPGVPINFLPSTGTATFRGFSDFAVLNRLSVADTSRQILLNGTISSTINNSPGGAIYFYSPSGFIVGSQAAINVGSLVLSASPIAVDGNGGFINGSTVTFNQAPNPLSSITTVAGSNINAYGAGSYVALVAPSITHSGTIRTDTAAALVAAEEATITFSPDGLFGIQITNGTDAAIGIDVDGGTIARNSAVEGGGNHRAYLVAIARNDAVEMLVRNGGSVGFDTATSAAVEDNVVILSGGHDVNGTPNIPSGVSSVNLTIDHATLSSDTFGIISGGANITTSTGPTSFGNDLTLFAGDDSFIRAINGNSLAIGGTLFASVDVFGSGPQTSGNLLRFGANANSTLTVGGNVFLSAQSFGAGADVENSDAGDATGGTVIVQTGSGSTIEIAGNLGINVDGYGGNHNSFDGAAGSGTGGIAHILANGGSGSAITVAGTVSLSANGTGGTTGECSSCQITGGNGSGGTILLQASVGSGNQINLDSAVTLNANGFGGAGDVVGGIGTGGTVQFQSGDAGAIAIAGNLIADASGQGGFGLDNGVSGGTGGAAVGGNASILFFGAPSVISLGGQSNFTANASGGNGVNGGNATGGWVNLQVSSGGTLTTGLLIGSANAIGGSGNIGGTATGGRAWLQAIAGGDIVADSLFLEAEGFGGNSDTGNGANADGGYVIASASNATLTVTGALGLQAEGRGGRADGLTGTGGSGDGGQADVFADNGGAVTLNGAVSLSATGRGGGYFSDLATGGNGTGGLVYFQASNGATLDAASTVTLSANGFGGFSFGDCNNCGGTGGNGTGGQVIVQAFGTGGGLIDVAGLLSLSAGGFGSFGYAGAGGNGLGGTARVFITDGSTLDLASDLIVAADGEGGGQDNGGLAGNGTGGLAEVTAGPGANAVTITGVATVSASGAGGNASGTGSIGGNGRGGFARILSQGGLANFLSDVEVRASGAGGAGTDGNGGDGTAGQARLVANGGDVTVAADLVINAISTGGDGNFGGNAIAFIGNDPQNTATSDARLLATNGDVVVTGATFLDASAAGGNGANGGDGGNASAAYATIHTRNSNLGPSSITLGSVLVDANGYGGGGGAGVFGDPGGNGGNGGSGIGGLIAITGSAGNGTLAAGDVIASASGFGGDGGDGGGSEILAGGNGGSGGYAEGGFLNIGTESGIAQATGTNNGSATFASIIMLASATGGSGGDLGFGNSLGLVGDGGDAQGGQSVLLVRGSPVTVGDVLMDASATGGNGGFDQFENPGGSGGNATSGQVGVLATSRLNLPLQRGTLTAGNIVGIADALGGGGATNGLAGSSGGLGFSILDSDATIASVTLSGNADFFDPASPIAAPSQIAVRDGVVTIAGGLTVTTPGEISMWADGGTLDAAAIIVGADNFIHDPSLPVTFVPGTYSAGTISLTTGQDLIVDAHLDKSGISLFGLNAPGLIDIWNAESDGALALTAGTTLSAGDLSGGTLVAVNAAGDIDVGNILAGTQQVTVQSTGGGITAGSVVAGDYAALNALNDVTTGNIMGINGISSNAGGSVTTGNLTSSAGLISIIAGGSITTGNLSSFLWTELDAFGDIDFGNVNADTFDFETDGSVTGGDIIAGTYATGEALGAITLGDISVGIARTGGPSEDGFAVGMASATSITVGDVEADESIGFATSGNLSAGNLDAGLGVMALVGGDISLGSITTPTDGLVYLADSSMFIDAGGPDDFDPLEVLARDPVPTGGSITINGPVTTGSFRAAAGTSLTTGAINATSITALAGGLLTIDGLWQAEEVEARSDDIAIAASGGIDAGPAGAITLVSTNGSGALIGDGLTGNGYALSNAEFGRLRSGNLLIAAGGVEGADGQMTIGQLDITGPLVGSTIDDPNGGVTFVTLDEAGEGLDGQIRIVGGVKATGLGANNFLEFLTENFNLDADTGSIRIEGIGGAIGGILDITADRIHVASGAVLDKLDADPLYDGREADLAAPLAVARPDGVIAAETIYVSPTEAVLVQNTGTTSLRAGFIARTVELFAPEGAAPGSIELIVNGQLEAEGGTLTGVAVRDALVLDTDLSIYSETSSINGCRLTGSCGTFGGGPGFTPLPGIPDEIRLIDRGKLPPPLFGNEDFIDDNDEQTDDGATSPIKPPQPLFDTRPLDTRGDVDDPVSGSGNPALMSPPPGTPAEEKKP